jgi:hypothetical protein
MYFPQKFTCFQLAGLIRLIPASPLKIMVPLRVLQQLGEDAGVVAGNSLS